MELLVKFSLLVVCGSVGGYFFDKEITAFCSFLFISHACPLQMGVRELYRGFSVIILRNGLSNSLFFTMREPLRRLILSLDDHKYMSKTLSERFANLRIYEYIYIYIYI